MRQDQNFLLICMSMQLPNVWEDELHNVVQMNYGTSAPSDSQDVNGITPFYKRLAACLIGQMSSDPTKIYLMLLQGLYHQVI